MPMKTFNIVIAAEVEPLAFWQYKQVDTEYSTIVKPTADRSLQNVQGYIRYKNVLSAIGSLATPYNFILVTEPTDVTQNVVNLNFTVQFNDNTLTTQLLHDAVVNCLNKEYIEKHQIWSNTNSIVYPFSSPNNRIYGTADTLRTTDVIALPVAVDVIVTEI